MSDRTAIEWAANADGSPGATWNPIVGCSVLTPGCTNCYAMREAARNERQIAATGGVSPYAGLTQTSKAGPVWTGEVRLIEHALRKPLGWKKPRTIFVNSMGDLFHEQSRFEWLDQVFAIMALCPQHTFIVLTKRSDRMRLYITDATLERLADAVPSGAWQVSKHEAVARITGNPPAAAELCRAARPAWPLPNVWLGVSTEDQRRADERIPDLLQTPAAVRLISAEPLLGAIDLRGIGRAIELGKERCLDALRGELCTGKPALDKGMHREPWSAQLDWVIAGGESGEGARPMHPDWARQLRNQCQAAQVPFFFKQWGAWAPRGCTPGLWITADGELFGPCASSDARIDAQCLGVSRVGKATAGRMIDGRTHDDRPPLTRSAA